MCENLSSSSLCHACVSVVDGPEGELLVEKALHMEAKKTILSGAAVFFPDKLIRRERLFHMMVSTELSLTCHFGGKSTKKSCPKQNDVTWTRIYLFTEKYYRT